MNTASEGTALQAELVNQREVARSPDPVAPAAHARLPAGRLLHGDSAPPFATIPPC